MRSLPPFKHPDHYENVLQMNFTKPVDRVGQMHHNLAISVLRVIVMIRNHVCCTRFQLQSQCYDFFNAMKVATR